MVAEKDAMAVVCWIAVRRLFESLRGLVLSNSRIWAVIGR
jgi:hypothetical protein